MSSRKPDNNQVESFRSKVGAVVVGALIYTLFAPTIQLFGTMIVIRIALALGII